MSTDKPSVNGRDVQVPFGPGDIVRTPANLTDVFHYDWHVGKLALSPLSRSQDVPDSGDHPARQAILQALIQGKWNRYSPLLARRHANMLGMALAPISSLHSGLWLVGYPPDYQSPGVYHYLELTLEPSDTINRSVLARSFLEQFVSTQAVAHLQLEMLGEAIADCERALRALQKSSDATALLGELHLPFEDTLKQYGGEFDPDDPFGWRMLTEMIGSHMEQRLATSTDLTTKLDEAVRNSSVLNLDGLDVPGDN